MENINYICGKTKDGATITLDGFRVESFMIYGNNAGDTIVDIYFKSGEEVEVNAFTDEGDSIPDGLADCFLAAKKNPEILTRPYPVNLIGCDHSVVPASVKQMAPDAFSGCSCEPQMKERFPVESPDDWINDLF